MSSSPQASGVARVLGIAIPVAATGNLPALLLGSVAVQVAQDLDLDNTSLGLAVSLFFGIAALASVSVGQVVDRAGWRRSALMVAGLTAVSLGGIAATGHSFLGVLIFLFLGGIAFAGCTPTANALVADRLTIGRRGVVLGANQAAIPFSTVFTGLAVPAVALTVGWRWAFVMALVLPAAAALAAACDRGPVRSGGVHAPKGERLHSAGSGLRRLAIGTGLCAVSIGALTTFSVASAVRAGIDPGVAGVLVAGGGLVAATVRVLGGLLVDRIGGDGLRGVIFLTLGGTVGYILLATGAKELVVVGVVLAFGAGWGWPGLLHFALVHRFPQAPGAATGVVQTGLAAGTAAGPVIFGLVADGFGYGPAWTVCVLATALAAALIADAARRLPAPDLSAEHPVPGPDRTVR